jgi:SRSO17 transposase
MSAAREARPTIRFVDEYCQLFEGLFPEVRSFEAFKLLHLGMISEVKRKSLPVIARAVGLKNHQNLHHFLTESPWTIQLLRQRRLELILKVVNGRTLILLIDETGDCKKGKSTDYVKRQYIGNVGKKENGIVAVTAYGLVDGMILPLSFEVYKPRERLKDGDEYHSKPQIAATMIRMLQAMGFCFELVLADSLYGESKTNFVNVLDELNLPYILAIRSNHALWLPEDQEVYQEPWQTFERTFSNGTTEVRYMCEIVYGKRHRKQYWLLTTDPQTLPDNSTSFVMVAAPAVKLKEIGDSYGFRTWIEYGLKQSKDALGWADFRMTCYDQIEKWWEMVMSAFVMVSLFADAFNDTCPLAHQQFTGASVVEQPEPLETSARAICV